MNQEEVVVKLQDTILGYLGMTRADLEAAIAAQEVDLEEVAQEASDEWDDCWDDDDEYTEVVDDTAEEIDLVATLGSAIAGTLIDIDAGLISFESGREILDTVQAVQQFKLLQSQYD